MKKMFSLWKHLPDVLPTWLVCTLSAIFTIVACLLMLELPTTVVWGLRIYLGLTEWRYILLNMATIGILWCLFWVLCNRVWLADLLCGSTCGILAIINYYVATLHGMPLSFLLLRNFKTAMNVISSYTITVDRNVAKLLILLAATIVLAVLTRWLSGKHRKKLPLHRVLLRDGAILAVCALVFYAGYLGKNPIKPAKTIGWGWQEAYSKYGYLPCTVETFFQSISDVAAPEGYSQQAVDALEIPDNSQPETATPDVILILNETFSDLGQLMELETDVPVLDAISHMENLLSGYAISPGACGGTNSSEYEILCSNSMWLLPGVTPFNVLNLENSSSLVSHMTQLGYYTLGSHSEEPSGYSRVVAYRDLGFQDIYFWDDFQNKTSYADRAYPTDESLYENLIRWYEEAPEETPRFLYLLTMQNHGSYRTSDDCYDLIHVQNDLGEYTTDANEYLTSVSLSDDAFVELTEYFAAVDRPVIVCMLGDHIPAFAASLVTGTDAAETNLLQRTVPLLIWANFPLEEQDLGTMSMNYVIPTLLDIAGIQLSPYYSYLLQLKEQVPILTSYGDYYDAQGNRYTYDSDEGGPYQEAVDNYFYLEYENIQKERHQELFTPYGE